MLSRLRQWAARLKRDVIALWLAARSPDTPPIAKIVAGFIAAYALSPIDLFPDFIPILGYLDDLVIVPLGIALAVRLVPSDLMAKFRMEADAVANRPISKLAAAVILIFWLATVAAISLWFLPR